ncbi:MAG TPA: hypothetical protein VF245_06475 [Solirubrobacterales bacterium]
MRFIEMLGSAVIAAAVTMALVASSASANSETIVFCEHAELTCESPAADTNTAASAVGVELKTSLGVVECEKSLIELLTLNTLSTLLVIHLLALSFLNCKLGKTACTVTVDTLGLLSLTKIGALEASAKSTGGTKFTILCGKILNCQFGGEPLFKAHSSAGGLTKFLAAETTILPLVGKEFLCPDTAKWVATYDLFLSTVWIES